MAAPEHADVAIVLDRRLDLDAHQRMFAKGADNLLMRDFDEVGLLEDPDEFLAQDAIGTLEIVRGAMSCRGDFRVKVKIGLAQPLKLFEIAVMENGAQHAGKLPEARLLIIVEAAIRGEPGDNIRLPQRNEPIPLFGRGRLTRRFTHKTTANAIATIT